MSTDPQRESYLPAGSTAPDELHDHAPQPFIEEDAPSPMQITLLRNMSGQQRLALAERMFWEARELKAAGVRHHHPDWPEDQVMAEVNRIFLHART